MYTEICTIHVHAYVTRYILPTDGILASKASSSLLHKALFIVMVTTPGWSPFAASIAILYDLF